MYLLFAGYIHYPNAGVQDIKGVFDAVEDASDAYIKLVAEDDDIEWGQILDTGTMTYLYIYGGEDSNCYWSDKWETFLSGKP